MPRTAPDKVSRARALSLWRTDGLAADDFLQPPVGLLQGTAAVAVA